MDPKKQTLTPELKQVYDRVMNTQINKPEGTTSGSIPPTPQAAPGQTPLGGFAGAPQTGTTAQAPPASESQNEGFFSSVPPRPLTDVKPFVFTGNKVTTPQGATVGTQIGLAGGNKISGKIIAVLVVVLVILWALFWAKFFGLI